MSNLHVTAMTLSCAAGVGLDAVRASLNGNRSGLRANDFSDCSLETWIGRVEGVEAVELDGAWPSSTAATTAWP
jgi:3-oxoacyl-[acyl-carrier-protein] synthase I